MEAFFTAALIAIVYPTAVGTLIYKCVGADKSARYSDVRCEAAEACFQRSSEGLFNEKCTPIESAPSQPAARFNVTAEPFIDPCRADLQCWADKFHADADIACRPRIERLAKYQFRWEDGWLDRKLDHVAWLSKADGTVEYSGDWISMQNGFGAWRRMEYACDFNPATRTIINVTVNPRN